VTTRSFAAAAIAIAAVAGAARFADLAARPMHADEAIFAYKLGRLLETGAWDYEPGEYHGPVLHYVTAAVAWACGARSHTGLTETIVRIVPAVIGVLTAMTPLLLVPILGRMQALAAAALLAISPAMVYYSRYYIPEILLVFLTACLVIIVLRFLKEPGWLTAVSAGLLAGLMFAVKETGAAAAAVLAAAAVATRPRFSGTAKYVMCAGTVAVILIAFLIGPHDAYSAMRTYAARGFSGTSHAHPWHYYLRLLVSQEWLITLLAIAAFITGKTGRFFAVFAGGLLLLYSLIPYKTPWCVLSSVYGLALLAGAGFGGFGSVRTAWLRRAAYATVSLATIVWAIQSYRVSHPKAADPGNPYAYAYTSRDIYSVAERLEALSNVHEAGRGMPVQVISAGNIWPLPWYLRHYSKVEWRRAITADMHPAPVILATPDVEPALVHHLYEVMPPGRRPLYVPLQQSYTELRPGMEIRGYVQQSLAGQAP
jgi:predicted membrane-bound mannosyltransferase